MKQSFIFISIFLLNISVRAQSAPVNRDSINKVVSFKSKIDISKITKDGIYLNGYVVDIPYRELTKLNGRTVRVTGKVTLVLGTKHKKSGRLRQGRYEDAMHILNPKIEVIED